MIGQSTPGSTIGITARIATQRGPSDQISTVSGPPFVKLCLKIKRGCMYLLSLRVAIRQQMATAAAASSRIAVLDKREANAVLHNGTTRTHLSHSFAHVAAPSPFCPNIAKRLRHVRRGCDN